MSPTKLTLYVTPAAFKALYRSSERARISRTDAANRALLIYSALHGASFWRAVIILAMERAEVRRLGRRKEEEAPDEG